MIKHLIKELSAFKADNEMLNEKLVSSPMENKEMFLINADAKKMEMELSTLREEVNKLKKENEALKDKVSNKVKVFLCHICDAMFPVTNDLKVHIKNAHKHQPNIDHIEFECEICGLKFSCDKLRDRHMNWIHQQGIVKTAEIKQNIDFESLPEKGGWKRVGPQFEAETEKLLKHICTWGLCRKEFESKILLKTHFEDHKVQDELFECEFCDDVFSKKMELQRHIINEHSSKRPMNDDSFTCNNCHFQTSYEHELIKHVVQEKHQPSNPDKININKIFKCNICQIYVRSKHDILIHRKAEHPSKMLCRDFVKGYCRRNDSECLFVHRLEPNCSNTPEESWKCFVCGNVFRDQDAMMIHKKNIHETNIDCIKFKEGKCIFYVKCWYNHLINEQQSNSLKTNQHQLNFQMRTSQNKPPEWERELKPILEKMLLEMIPLIRNQLNP